MLRECTHILASGRKCKAPAVAGSSLCRHHRPRRHVELTRFVLPEFEDHRSLFRAISAVLHAASRRRIRRSEAGTYLFGLQLAARFMPHFSPLSEPVPAPIHHSNKPRPKSPSGSVPKKSPSGPVPNLFPADAAAVHRSSGIQPPRRPVEGRAPMVYEATVEDADQFLATMQSSSIDDALDEWEAKLRTVARNTRPNGHDPARRGVPSVQVSALTGRVKTPTGLLDR